MKKKFLTFFTFFCFVCNAQTWDNLTFDNDVPGLNSNPVRGLILSDEQNGARNFPYSMEFFYIPLRGTMLNINSFDWSNLENKLNNIASRGNTAVFRFYMDYPGRSTAVPQFLIDAGVAMTSHNAPSLIPDYDDPRCMAAITNFIEKLGEKYDNDPRISIIQAGLYGFWGEWHHYQGPPGSDATEANLQIIFNKYVTSFPTTKLNFRGIVGGLPVSELLKVGYHDDSFMYETLGPVSWKFWPRLTSAGVTEFWRNHPMGGEMRPEVQGSAFETIPNPSVIPDPNSTTNQTLNVEDYETCVNTTHASYMYNFEIWQHPVGSIKHNNAIIQNKKLGYKFYINGVKLNASQNGTIDLDVRIENRGVAPFYFNWNVEFALFKDNKTIPLGTTNWNINTIQPNDVVVKNYAVNKTLLTGSYTILMRFVNPLTANRPNAKQLHFANAEQNADKDGWISLKTFNKGVVQEWVPLSYNANQPNLERNPLKGLATMFNLGGGFTDATAFPHSIRGKLFGLDDIMTGMNTFDWSVVDNFLLAEAAKGNHSYIQVNIDPAFGNSDMPSFLATQVDFYDYIAPNNLTVSDKCPNWNDPELMTAMENFIAAFGAKYNSDQRVFLVHLGLYGMWGEWHIGETENFRPEFEMTPNNKKRIANAYKLAFPDKQLLARYPENMPDPQIYGYSDGLFFGQSISETKPKYFHNILKTAKADENWKLHPIGGEVDPKVQPTIFDVIPNVTNDIDTDLIPNVQSVSESLKATHPTWLFIHHMFQDAISGSQEWNNALQIQKDLGYTFFIEKARISAAAGFPTVEVNIQNKGIAPMYANWDVEMGVLNSGNQLQSLGIKKWDLNLIQPNVKFNNRIHKSNLSLSDGNYKVVIRVLNPLQANAAQTKPVRFANTTQDIDLNGWITLGQVNITGGNAGVTPINVAGLTISPANATLTKGQLLQITENLLPTNATNTSLTWVSNRPATASVDSGGLVNAGSIYGPVEISAYSQYGGFVGKSQIIVEPVTIILPAVVQAENFIGMNGIQVVNSPANGQSLGFINGGDWVDYNVTVTEPTDFKLDVRFAAAWGGAQIQLINDNNQVLTSVGINYTGGYSTFTTKTSPIFTLPAGKYNLRLNFTNNGFDVDWIEFKSVSSSYRPIPALLEAESFDEMSGFTLEACSEGGQNFGFTDTGDWAEYNVKVEKNSLFTIDSRLAGTYQGSLGFLNQNNEILTTIQTPNTGGWQTYTTVPSKMFQLPEGNQRIRLKANSTGFNINWIQFKLVAPLTFCGNTTVGSATGSTSLKFYTDSTGGTTLDTNTMLSSGNYYVTETIGGIEGSRNYVAVTINTMPAAPVANAQTFCTKTTVADLIATGTDILKWYNTVTGGTALASNADVVTGNYYVSQTNASKCESPRNLVVVTVNTTTWDGANWNNGTPDISKGAIISGNLTTASNLIACSLEVVGSASVIVPSGLNFTVSGKVKVASSASLTFENNANLIQTSNSTNIGNIVVKRSAAMRRQDYVFWGSPVSGQFLKAFSPETLDNRFYTYSEAINDYLALTLPSTTVFEATNGYMLRAPNNFPTYNITAVAPIFNGTFIGVPNNGNYTYNATNSGAGFGYNMMSNPYPSPISASQFIATNPGTLYFWTHTAQGAAVGANYAVYNGSGGTKATAIVEGNTYESAVPNGNIQIGQGFIYQTSQARTVSFTNAMRTGNNNDQFFRSANTTERNRIWLRMTGTETINQVLVAYITGATNNYDDSFDGLQLATGNAISSTIGNQKYAIQGRSLPFANTDIVPLNLKIATAGNFTLKIDEVDGLFAGNQNIYLKDNLVGITHNIKASPYNFVAAVGEFSNRFELVYKDSVLGIETPNLDASSVVVFVKNNNININSGNVNMKTIEVFDVRGRLIFDKKDINASTFEIQKLKAQQAVLVVKITAENGSIVSKKIVY